MKRRQHADDPAGKLACPAEILRGDEHVPVLESRIDGAGFDPYHDGPPAGLAQILTQAPGKGGFAEVGAIRAYFDEIRNPVCQGGRRRHYRGNIGWFGIFMFRHRKRSLVC
jgi:hypothetical protein